MKYCSTLLLIALLVAALVPRTEALLEDERILKKTKSEKKDEKALKAKARKEAKKGATVAPGRYLADIEPEADYEEDYEEEYENERILKKTKSEKKEDKALKAKR